MNREEQRELLTAFMDQVRDHMLSRSDHWPEDWDGFELRWLAQHSVNFEAPEPRRMGIKRYRDFENDWTTKNLY